MEEVGEEGRLTHTRLTNRHDGDRLALVVERFQMLLSQTPPEVFDHGGMVEGGGAEGSGGALIGGGRCSRWRSRHHARP